MKYIGDILLESRATDAHVAQAVAEAFGVDRVTVWPMAQVMDREADIIVQRDDQAGDFPFLMRLTATPSSGLTEDFPEPRFVTCLRSMARSLNQVLLTDTAGVIFQDNFLLVAPGGETIEVTVDDDGLNEGRISLTPESRARRANLVQPTAVITP